MTIIQDGKDFRLNYCCPSEKNALSLYRKFDICYFMSSSTCNLRGSSASTERQRCTHLPIALPHIFVVIIG